MVYIINTVLLYTSSKSLFLDSTFAIHLDSNAGGQNSSVPQAAGVYWAEAAAASAFESGRHKCGFCQTNQRYNQVTISLLVELLHYCVELYKTASIVSPTVCTISSISLLYRQLLYARMPLHVFDEINWNLCSVFSVACCHVTYYFIGGRNLLCHSIQRSVISRC